MAPPSRMTTDESLGRFGLVPEDASLDEVRALLEQEAEAERTGRPRVEDLALLSCVQLFSRGKLEDVLRIWRAKRSGFDLGCYLDVQLLCGAGLEATKQFRSADTGCEAREALDYIVSCEATGDFDGFTAEDHLQDYRRYFGV